MSPTPVVYLAHPIDFADPNATRAIVERIALMMHHEHLAAYIPGYAFKTPHGAPPNRVVGNINRAALAECDALIAYLPPRGTTSLGVPMEIEQARAAGKPTVIVGDPDVWTSSWALPMTDLVIYTDEIGHNTLTELRGLVAREKRRKERPHPVRSMYVQVDPGASLPTRSYEGDAGFDLYTTEETVIPAGEFIDVPVGCRVQFPDRVWGLIIGRSSTVRKLDLLVTPGVIDTGYRGPLFAGVRSMRSDDYLVKAGERLAQMIPFPNLAMSLHAVPVDVLAPSDRGESGFGSSGA